jgi:hypothetical protein
MRTRLNHSVAQKLPPLVNFRSSLRNSVSRVGGMSIAEFAADASIPPVFF